ncbi:phage baseplate assembly protein [Hydrocarboniphaga effusa]|uniref:phage baseplate assembly protein n=1 Tax=Hydrocarboniphaga effusa TaxID=243629 RepID=UPI003BA91E7C
MSVSIQVGAQIFGGWKSAEINVGIEQLAGAFSLGCADTWALKGENIPLLPGQTCAVKIYDVPVITGFIDAQIVSYSKNEHGVTIEGRDATGDLVDSAAEVDGQGWKGRTLMQIAEDLCKPFGIPVSIDANIGNAFAANIYKKRRKGLQGPTPHYDDPFDCQQINPCETVFDVLSRAARLRGCLLISDGVGGLRITTAGSERATRTLQLGVDILKARSSNSHAERFHTYKVLGQQNQVYAPDGAAIVSQQIAATETDPAIRRGRVTVIDPIDQLDTATAQRLAQWARANREARGIRSELTVRGWRDGDRPWRANTIVRVVDSFSRLSGDYLIASVRFSIDDQAGEIATLTVTPPAAYVPQPDHETMPNLGFAS